MELMMQPTNRLIDEMKVNAYLNERVVYLTDSIIDEDTEFIINRMLEKIVERDKKAKIEPQDAEPITLKISSYGGSIFATLSIISTIETLKDMGYKVIGMAYGKVMSGGFKIFITCSERICQKHTRFLFHQVQSFEVGTTSVEHTKRRLKDLDELWRRCQDIILKYTNISQKRLDEITELDLDVALWSEEALSLNVTDRII